MDFPSISVFLALQRTYALFLFYGGLIFRLMWLPFVLLVIWMVGVDLVVLAAFPQLDPSSAIPIWVTLAGEFLAELVILNFLAIRIFRLLLLEHADERSVFDGTPLSLLPRYGFMYLSIGAIVVALAGSGWMLASVASAYIGVGAYVVLGLFLFAGFVVYCWLSFVLPAASIPVRYRFQESTWATNGALVQICIVNFFAALPWFLLSYALPVLVGADQGPGEWEHWAIIPFVAGLHCIRTIFFVLANAVCFEERTGWQPGAEKVEVE